MAERKKLLQKQAEPIPGLPNIKPREINSPNIKGTFPFANTLISKEKKTVSRAVYDEIQDILSEENVLPEAEKAKAVKPAQPVNIEDLSEEEQEHVIDAIKSFAQKPEVAPTKKPAAPFIPANPAVAKAKEFAEKVAVRTEKPKENPVEIQTVYEKPGAQEDYTADPILPVRETCSHCGWPVGQSDFTKPTEVDKRMFRAAMLGQKRFYKTFELLGGDLKVTFRTLTVQEIDLVVKQLMVDWNSGKISGPLHSVAEATKYQMLLALQSVETSVGPITLPELKDYEYEVPEGPDTILPSLLEEIYNSALTNEPLRRIVSKAYGHFIDTTSKLEAMAETADFW